MGGYLYITWLNEYQYVSHSQYSQTMTCLDEHIIVTKSLIFESYM